MAYNNINRTGDANITSMEERYVLLKLKREWSQDEAIKASLKIISDLQMELGITKSERDEALAKLAKKESVADDVKELQRQLTEALVLKAAAERRAFITVQEGSKTRKAWMRDELVAELEKQMKADRKARTEIAQSRNEWRNKYFNLLAKTDAKLDSNATTDG